MKTFEIGKRYGVCSICNNDCWWFYTVIARTACTITLKSDDGDVLKCKISKKISEMFGIESVYPLGQYSMAPRLSADNYGRKF